MIYIGYRGRLGNKIFQYVLARILSEKFNQRINKSLDKPEFSFTEKEIINRKVYEKTILVDDNNFLEILELKNLNSTNLVLNGYFQNISFVSKYREKILEIIDINYQEKQGIFLHYRLGDLITNRESIIPKEEYYTHCIDKILETSKEKVYISTDSPNHNLIKNLQEKYNATLIKGSPKDTIIYGSQFKNKILSFGTFSWWIGFLGNQNNVYCPNSKEYGYGADIFPLERWKSISKKEYLQKRWKSISKK